MPAGNTGTVSATGTAPYTLKRYFWVYTTAGCFPSVLSDFTALQQATGATFKAQLLCVRNEVKRVLAGGRVERGTMRASDRSRIPAS